MRLGFCFFAEGVIGAAVAGGRGGAAPGSRGR